MFSKFADKYGAEVVLILIIILMLIGLVFTIAKYLLPYFKGMKVGNIRMTLGFYVLTFCFGYFILPYFIKLDETKIPLFREGMGSVMTIAGIVINHYFKSKETTN